MPDEPNTVMDRICEILFFRWWGALLGGLAFFALAYLIWPGRPKNPDDARAFKANVQVALLSGAAALCGVGMLVVAVRNLLGLGGDEPPPPGGNPGA
jgi:hypothetical protein